MKSLLKAVAVLLCMMGSAQAEVVAPDVLIRNTAQEIITIVKQDADIKAGSQKKLLELVDAKVLPNFDFVRMTQLAMGKNWRNATNAQKQALVTEFRNMLVRTYAKAFSAYRDQTVEVLPLRMAAGDTETTVKSRIVKTGGQPLPVNYEMRKTDAGWKVFDVTIESVSLVTSYRGTFESQISQSGTDYKAGIDAVIKTLVDKNAKAAESAPDKASGK